MELEGILKIICFQTPAMGRDTVPKAGNEALEQLWDLQGAPSMGAAFPCTTPGHAHVLR